MRFGVFGLCQRFRNLWRPSVFSRFSDHSLILNQAFLGKHQTIRTEA